MSGLSDEAGAAMPLAMASKQLGFPVDREISQLEAYVHETLFPGNGSQAERKQYYVQVHYGQADLMAALIFKPFA